MIRSVCILAATVVVAALAARAAWAPVQSEFGVLDVRLTRPAGATYIEGAAWHLRVIGRLSGKSIRVFDAETLTENRLTLRRMIPAARYTVISYMRPCNGNCSRLDPPADRCSGRTRIRGGRTTRVSVALNPPGQGCSIRVAG
jgi:hypothetical protein